MSAPNLRLLLTPACTLAVLLVSLLVAPLIYGAEQYAPAEQRPLGGDTATPTATATSTATSTATPTATVTNSATATVTFTASSTATITLTRTVTLTPTVTSTATTTPTVTNTATITLTPTITSTPTMSPTATPLRPDLRILKSASSQSPVVGDPLGYMLTVSNIGDAASPGSLVLDPLPARTTFLAAGPLCNFLNGNVQCTVPGLAPGESVIFSFVVRIDELGVIDNVAIVDPDNLIDEGPASREVNNTARLTLLAVNPSPTSTATPTVTNTPTRTSTPTVTSTATTTSTTTNTPTPTATSTPLLPDLRVQKSAQPNPAVFGSTLTYSITVSNAGPGVSNFTTLSDQIPSGTTFVSTGAGCGLVNNSISCSVASLAPNGVQTFAFVVNVTTPIGPILNTVQVDPNNNIPETDETNNVDTTVTNVVLASLTPTRTIAPTATVTPIIGGRSFTLDVNRNMIWTDGSAEAFYFVIRWGPNTGNIFLPPSGPLPGNATSFTDTSPVNDVTLCELVTPYSGLPAPETLLGFSDLLCWIPGGGFGARPGNFAIRLNQSETATMTWTAPGGQSDYELVAFTFDGSPQRTRLLGAAATAVQDDTFGKSTCYFLRARSQFGGVFGQTDTLCAVPHVSSLGTASVSPAGELPFGALIMPAAAVRGD